MPMRRATFIGGIVLVAIVGASTQLEGQARKGNRSPIPPYQAPGTGAVARTIGSKLADIVSVKDFGAIGNGVADDTLKVQAALNAGAATVLFPPGTYLTTPQAAVNYSLTIPSNVNVLAYGAKIVFTHPGPVNANAVAILLDTVSNVSIAGLEIDGTKDSIATVTEQMHGIRILSSSRVTLRDIYSHHNRGDGVYIGALPAGTPSSDVIAMNVLADSNHRQGMSISSLRGGRFYAFRGTHTAGTAPQAGLDLEPNVDADTLTNLWFYGCEFTGNAGAGGQLLFRTTSWQKDIHFIGCKFDNNTTDGIFIANSEQVSFTDSSFASNGLFGIELSSQGARDLTFTNVTIAQNQQRGVSMIIGTGFSYQRISFTGGRITDNGQSAANSFDGIRADGTLGSFSNLQLVGVDLSNRIGATQRYGISTVGGATMTNTKMTGCSFVGNATNGTLLGDDVASRQLTANDGTINNVASFFQVNLTQISFSGLGTPANGALLYCTNCTLASPCAAGGTGAIAKRLNGAWVCN